MLLDIFLPLERYFCSPLLLWISFPIMYPEWLSSLSRWLWTCLHYFWPHIPSASLPPTNAALGRYKGTPFSNFFPHYPPRTSSCMTPYMCLSAVWASGSWIPPGYLVKVQPRWHERPPPLLQACKAPAPRQTHSSLSSPGSSPLPRPRPRRLEKGFGKSQWRHCPPSSSRIHSH